MKTIFSQQLVQCRRGAGFTTAYRFFHDNGGQAVLKLTYRSYLRLETGQVLPPLQKLSALICALRLGHNSPEADALVAAWLKTMAGPDAYRDLLERPLGGITPAAAPATAEAALKLARLKRTYSITPGQYAALSSSYEHFRCCHFITNSDAFWTAAQLAAAAKALRDLAKVKLITEVKKGVCKCLVNHNIMALPEKRSLPPDQVKRYAGYLDRLAAEGSSLLQRRVALRADALVLTNGKTTYTDDSYQCDIHVLNSRTMEFSAW